MCLTRWHFLALLSYWTHLDSIRFTLKSMSDAAMRCAMRQKWKHFGMKLEFVEGLTLLACLFVCTFFLSCSLRACRSGDPCFQVDWAAARKVPMPRLMQQSFDDWNILKSLHLEML